MPVHAAIPRHFTAQADDNHAAPQKRRVRCYNVFINMKKCYYGSAMLKKVLSALHETTLLTASTPPQERTF